MDKRETIELRVVILIGLIFIPSFVFAATFVVRSVNMDLFSKIILGGVVLVCAWILLKIIFVNFNKGKEIKFAHRFDDLERLYNTSSVLVFSYANAWYKYAPHTASQALASHDNMRDMRATATTQIVSYLLGRDYINQDAIKDRTVRERSVLTRSYVPLWADEIMGREPLFRELVLYSLKCGNYLEDLESKNERIHSEHVDLGTLQRRNQIIKKYSDVEEIKINLKRYKDVIKQFSVWDDQYLTYSDAEKSMRGEKGELFLNTKND